MADVQASRMMRSALIVEDEALVAMVLEDILTDAGFDQVLTASTLQAGLSAVEQGEFDFAILDMTLGRDSSFPIADLLERRGVPFLFASGYDAQALPEQHSARTVLSKPFMFEDVIKKMAAVSGRPDCRSGQ